MPMLPLLCVVVLSPLVPASGDTGSCQDQGGTCSTGGLNLWQKPPSIQRSMVTDDASAGSDLLEMPAGAANTCQKRWQQCGGKNWKGSTCCEESGWACTFVNDYYSQCKKASGQQTTTTTTTTTTASTTSDSGASTTQQANCRKAWQQCGGSRYTGATCCEPGWECHAKDEWYSQCRTQPFSTTTKATTTATTQGATTTAQATTTATQQTTPTTTSATTTAKATTTSTQQTSPPTTSAEPTTSTTTTTTTTATTTEVVATTSKTTTKAASTATTTVASTSVTTTESTTSTGTTATPSTSGAATTTTSFQCVGKWKKCGGGNYDGPTACCDAGYVCEGGQYYKQCKKYVPTTTTTTTEFTSPSAELSAHAQFLIQATFGPTRESIAELSKMSYADWIQGQLAAPVGSHREYYRKRANPGIREPGAELDAGSPRPKCAAGSRWRAFAFSDADVGRNISVRDGRIFVGGQLRSDINPSSAPTACNDNVPADWQTRGRSCYNERNTIGLNCGTPEWIAQKFCQKTCFEQGYGYVGDDCTGRWASQGAFEGFICQIRGGVRLSDKEDCSNPRTMSNPPIWLKDPGQAATGLSFRVLRSGVLVLAADAPACGGLADVVRADDEAPGTLYVHEPRLLLVRNTPEDPATSSTWSGGRCPAVPRTFLNEGGCRLLPGCMPLGTRQVAVQLNVSTLETFYRVGLRYVYAATKLRTTAPPCKALARWQKLDCGAADCTLTSLSPGDAGLVTNALRAEEDQGWLRDVNVDCASVPEGAVVQVGGDHFKHVHLHESNVYDFTDWVSDHPGGPEKIKQWASRGFKLEFPKYHSMERWESGPAPSAIVPGFVGKLGGSVDFQNLPQPLQTPELAEAFQVPMSDASYSEVCGSPGEVASEPLEGHLYAFKAESAWDRWFDDVYESGEAVAKLTRSSVWVMKALQGADQLRQRTAWALAQIFVLAPSEALAEYTEMFVSYYDIFVRHAFGNFRDILREVTYNPVMGDYLTYKRNRAFDSDSTYPDENYAREIMQLFTIGLWKLNPDGTRMTDNEGNSIQTYTNDHIMNLARVFTGFDEQQERANVEDVDDKGNMIDPMRMKASWHDAYPKPDLDGNYLGDGYPLCSDFPEHAFLTKGAKYHFLGHGHDGNEVLVAGKDSALYAALCSSAGGQCNFQLVAELGATVPCTGDECKLDTLKVVKVADGYFEYVPQACVNMFFFQGKVIAKGGPQWDATRRCANAGTVAAGSSCCAGGGKKRVCGHTNSRVRLSKAEQLCTGEGLQLCSETTEGLGCGYDDQMVWTPEDCQAEVIVYPDGQVSFNLTSRIRQNRFAVQWLAGHPAPSAGACPSGCAPMADACSCSMHVETKKVFSQTPTRAEVQAKLKIGSLLPAGPCTDDCDGEVRAYSSGPLDEDTVFECDGRFFKNREVLVHVGGHSFRNPPAFVELDEPRERDALNEVESLIDHLFHHPNTAPFVAIRMIQRFVTSNPTPAYVHAVTEAFKTGTYDGVKYSGRYGDLAATVAAVLLRQEARSQDSAANGALREPLLKVIHFMRSMEYQDRAARQVFLDDMMDEVGQFPYESPTVFNFYKPEFSPEGFPAGLSAPEFEIFTAPNALGFANGMASLINKGLSQCDGGFGPAAADCSNGEVTLKESDTLNETLAELDLLLTGGRLEAKSAVQSAYKVSGLKDAQKALVLTPEFNTLGAPMPMGVRPPAPPKPVGEAGDYKAVVMIFLKGGADTFNMLVPLNCPLYDEYHQVRRSVAMLPSQLNKITTSGQACAEFGVHPSLSLVKELYDKKQAAFVSNLGSLVEPLTPATYKKGGGGEKCQGLFSHSDQEKAAQTLTCQSTDASSKGAGGRMADALAAGAEKYRTTSFSLSGVATWSQGLETTAEILGQSSGTSAFPEYERLQTVIDNITGTTHGNVYSEAYAKQLEQAIKLNLALKEHLDKAELKTDYKEDYKNKASRQLKQVARLIAARAGRQAERDFFYVSMGGFDGHRNLADSLAFRFTQLDEALRAFVEELEAQQIFDSVTIVTHSDFGRTLTPNSGAGTDHAWAGNHLVLGGSVKGGQILNRFPSSLLEGSEQDAGRGRLIPKYPWESMMVPLAQWMGMEDSQSAQVFPNIGNFDLSSHIINRTSLFTR